MKKSFPLLCIIGISIIISACSSHNPHDDAENAEPVTTTSQDNTTEDVGNTITIHEAATEAVSTESDEEREIRLLADEKKHKIENCAYSLMGYFRNNLEPISSETEDYFHNNVNEHMDFYSGPGRNQVINQYEMDIDSDGEPESVLLGFDGSGQESWGFLYYYNDNTDEWLPLTRRLGTMGNVCFDDVLKEELLESMKQELTADEYEEISKGLQYNSCFNPLVTPDGQIIFWFNCHNGKGFGEKGRVLVNGLIGARFSAEDCMMHVEEYAAYVIDQPVAIVSDDDYWESIFEKAD